MNRINVTYLVSCERCHVLKYRLEKLILFSGGTPFVSSLSCYHEMHNLEMEKKKQRQTVRMNPSFNCNPDDYFSTVKLAVLLPNEYY